MNEPKRSLAVLFADISGSSVLYEKLGDSAAREVTADYLRLLTAIACEFQGTVVKTIGDEVMCAFQTADLAAQAAVTMQEETSSKGATSGERLSIKVGFHEGGVIEQQDDLFGGAVNIAAHIISQAKARQILTSEETAAALDPAWEGKTRLIDVTSFKGADRTIAICELLWGEEGDRTITSVTSPRPARGEPAHLRLSYQGEAVELDGRGKAVTIGRSPENDLVVPDDRVSRFHARIERRRGRFVLIEQSTNGSQVHSSDGKRSFLRREQHVLEGEGTITLGAENSADAQSTIQYSLKVKRPS